MKSLFKISRFARVMAMLLSVVLIAGLVGMKSAKTAEAAPAKKVTVTFYEKPQDNITETASQVGPKIEVDKNTTLGKIDIPLKAEEGKTYKVAGVYSRTSR